MTTRAELVENVRAARYALAKFDEAEAEAEVDQANRDCKCNPDTRDYDPYCRVPDAMQQLDRARAEVLRFRT